MPTNAWRKATFSLKPIGPDPADECCVQCGGSDGQRFLFSPPNSAHMDVSNIPGSLVLHEACAEACFAELIKYDERISADDNPFRRPKAPDWLEKRRQEQTEYRKALRGYKRGEPNKPEPPEYAKFDQIREQARERVRPNGGGAPIINPKVVRIIDEREQRERQAQQQREQEERAGIAAIQAEDGLPYESARLLYRGNRSGYHVSGIERETFEALETQIAKARATRALLQSKLADYVDRGSGGERAAAPSQRTSQQPPGSLDEWNAGLDPGTIPPRQWLLGNQFCRGFISSIVAAGGTGKSALRLLQFVALALGRELSG
jgi:AAA domain-containing protein